jgi:hypothetical protein
MLVCAPRLSVHSEITGPTYSCGTKILHAMIGSRNSSMSDGSGRRAGLEICSTVPSRSWTS